MAKYTKTEFIEKTSTKLAGFEPERRHRLRNLFPTYTYSETDDVITGCYNNVDYEIAKTKLVVKGRKNNEFDVFKGVIISFKPNKDFNTETLVTTKGDNNIRNYPANSKSIITFLIVFSLILPTIFTILFISTTFSKLGSMGLDHQNFFKILLRPENMSFVFNMLMPIAIIALFAVTIYNQKKKMHDVKLEDTSFDKKFNVYTKDQIEARYLLTPTFMERLKSLETAFGTKGVKCSFFNNRIMFAIPAKKDLFELGSLYAPLNSNKSVENFYNELNSIHEMIDHFKLNEKIGI